ncbi:hypothetical protein OD350_29150 (plasmid) [Clostridium beijerinckii]|uniref:hypothetical protein n=1 Tax=Clostridium beijerinckii TaxID=1520 RepID=UPI002225CDE9|nr:hypothetical protein [Clostridium beijerinckii]UYZ38957.1 hypothetical protein OD350_29150 [Clostridium beijerinckii]
MGILKEDEHLVFINKDSDVLGNVTYTPYSIIKNEQELILKFEKKLPTCKLCKVQFEIETIQTVKDSSTGKLVLPNFISQNDILEGTYKGGYSFKFENIAAILIEKEGNTDNG